jgi:signal peptidase II
VTRRAAWARAAGVTVAVIAADQATKLAVDGALARGDRASLVLGIDLVNVRNRGVAFGAFADSGALIAVIVGLALLALLIYFLRHATRRLAWLPTGLLLGGALGNAIDRIREGAVIDFVKLPLWPAFNVADVAITAGVVALLFVLEQRDPGPAEDRRAAERPA